MLEWKDYGDVNPLTEGGIWITKDIVISGNCYIVVKYTPRDGAFIDDLYVDIDATWIDRKAVCSYSDIQELDSQESMERFAIACTDYYGAENFGITNIYEQDELDEAKEWLKDRGINIEN